MNRGLDATVDDLAEFGCAGIHHVLENQYAGIGHDDIHPAEMADHLVGGADGCVLVGHVQRHSFRALADLPGGLLDLIQRDLGDADRCTLRNERLRDRQAYALRAAGDKGHLAVEKIAQFSALLQNCADLVSHSSDHPSIGGRIGCTFAADGDDDGIPGKP